MKKLKIGGICLNNPVVLAPMVDITDAAYRKICKQAGASLAYIEMLNIGAILHKNKKTEQLMKLYPGEKPGAIQITGNNISEFKKVAPYLSKYDLIDINCGCPSIRITGNQSGSYLLRNPQKIKGMIRTMKDAGFTVTAKIRLGFKKNNVLTVAKYVEKAGADALTIHARMAYHGNDVPAEWKWIAKVKNNIGIPVIGNGDINSGKKAQEMLEITDGVMIARAAIGNPLIFRDILYYLNKGKEREKSFKDNLNLFIKYLELSKKYGIADISRIKYLGSNFIRGIPGAASWRQNLMQKKNIKELEEFAGTILNSV